MSIYTTHRLYLVIYQHLSCDLTAHISTAMWWCRYLWIINVPLQYLLKKNKIPGMENSEQIKYYGIYFAPRNILVHGIHIWYQMRISQNFPHLQCHFTWCSWSSGKQDTPSWEGEHTLQASVTCCLQQHISSLWRSSKWPL